MSLTTWLARLERQERKQRKSVNRRNLRLYRQRQAKAGARRIDLLLTPDQYAVLVAQMRPGESYSRAIGRVIEVLSGNNSQLKTLLVNQ